MAIFLGEVSRWFFFPVYWCSMSEISSFMGLLSCVCAGALVCTHACVRVVFPGNNAWAQASPVLSHGFIILGFCWVKTGQRGSSVAGAASVALRRAAADATQRAPGGRPTRQACPPPPPVFLLRPCSWLPLPTALDETGRAPPPPMCLHRSAYCLDIQLTHGGPSPSDA